MKTYLHLTTFALVLLLVTCGTVASYAGGCGIDVTTSCSPSAGGKITSSSCTYTAVPNTGYVFSHWRISGETGNGSISAKTKTDNPYTIEDSYASIIGMYGGDLILTAYFTKVTTYTITWKNWDGSTLKTTTVNANATPSYTGSTPTRASTAQYSYTFKGWTPTIVAATANTTYTATYTQALRKYAIKFVNEDGTVLQNTQVAYGSTPSYTGSTPTKASTAQYTYTFKGWNPAITSVTGAATYTATYTQALRKYAITFVNVDGTRIGSVQNIEYGKNATPPTPPSREGYTFAGWIGKYQNVQANATIYASYYKNNEVSSAQPGALAGLFSVSADKRVLFSQGNLQYNAAAGTHSCADGTTKNGIWRFAEHQYDTIGVNNKNVSSTYAGWIDLFGWGTSGWNSGATAYQPWSTSINDADYYPGGDASNSLIGQYKYADWGQFNPILNGGNVSGVWRTITSEEMEYLYSGRPNAADKRSQAVIDGIQGYVLLPDIWVLPEGLSFTPNANNYTTNIYSVDQWQEMENNGAVFLPSAHYRGEQAIGKASNYWTSTSYDENNACRMIQIRENSVLFGFEKRHYGFSVRLIADIPQFTILANPSNIADGSVTGSGTYDYGTSMQITAIPNDCYVFTRWSDGNTDNPRTITVTGDATYTAEFAKINYTIRGQNASTTGGSVQVVNY